MKLASCLGVDPDWLSHGDEYFIEGVKPAPPVHRMVPLISWVQAGDWNEASDPYSVGDAEEWLPCHIKCGKNTFAVRVSGVSMEPEFKDGEVIIVDPSAEPRHNSFVVVRIDHENAATFKQLVVEGDTKYLRPLNRDFPTQFIEIDGNARISGVVVGKITSYL